MNITPLAEERINQTLSGSELLRIEVNGGGCNGFTVGLMKIAGQEENDIFLRSNVVIDPISEEYLLQATLDWKNDAFSETFHFDIPNTKSCGCGSSFQPEDT
jgi:iron-sulfur cluster assembly accessory protein